ncbi:MAG TPA: nuclear transport factor 2 family protein, partial [Candidatus Manganitrophaceae bacterium]|nr:nuclear transport factor 2 family protein [Candidatus Manganitrophaceae bacterium]
AAPPGAPPSEAAPAPLPDPTEGERAQPAVAEVSPPAEPVPPVQNRPAPPAVPPTNEERIRALIERQRRAYESQNMTLHKKDVSNGRGSFEEEIRELFKEAPPRRVRFEIFELKVKGEKADLSLMQTARYQKKDKTVEQKSLLFWELIRENGRWKIKKFNIVEKYPPTETGRLENRLAP